MSRTHPAAERRDPRQRIRRNARAGGALPGRRPSSPEIARRDPSRAASRKSRDQRRRADRPGAAGLPGRSHSSCRPCSTSGTDGGPRSARYSTTPNEKISDRASASPPRICSGAMYAGVPTMVPTWVRSWRVSASTGASLSSNCRFASPKSITLTCPCSPNMTLDGFRSRWTMPRACAACSASAIWMAIASASATRDRALEHAGLERRPLDELEHERAHPFGLLEAVNVPDVRVIERREDPGFALEAREPALVLHEGLRQHFQRDVTIEPDVACEIHLAHAAFPDAGLHHIRAETRAGLKCHEAAIIYRGGRNAPVGSPYVASGL